MPIYNVAPYVERALLSALNQTFDSIEFLIVDDRGTDNSMDIVREIIAEHPRGKDVRIIDHPHNIGLGATRNTAIDNAKGEYLFFMDSDDEITPDCIEVLYKAMMEEPVDFVAGSYNRIIGKNVKEGCYYERRVIRDTIPEFIYKERKAISPTTWNKLYSLFFLRDNNIYCYPHHINEDSIFHHLIVSKSHSCFLIPQKTYSYYYRSNSTEDNRSRNYSKRNVEELIEVFDFYKSLLDFYKGKYVYKYYFAWLIAAAFNATKPVLKSNCILKKDKVMCCNNISYINISWWRLFFVIPFTVKNITYLILMKIPYRFRSVLFKVRKLCFHFMNCKI